MRHLAARGLRVWTLAIRFLFVVILARFLLPQELGLYGLLVATVGYVIYALGVDLYTYTAREILTSERSLWRRQVHSHSAALAGVYAVLLPALVLLFSFGLLPWSVLPWFYVIVTTEHISFEFDRILVAMSNQFGASLVVFLRQGLMPTLVIPMFALAPSTRHLQVVLLAWIIFNLMAIATGWPMVSRALSGTSGGVDWPWIKRGLKVSSVLLVASLAIKVPFTVDRQIVSRAAGFEVLGAYTLAWGLGAGISGLLAVTIHQFSYPKLVQLADKRQFTAMRSELVRMLIFTLGVTAGAGLALGVASDRLIAWVGGGVYADFAWLFPAAVVVFGLYNVSLVPHYGLYALRGDRRILISTLAAAVVFLVVALVWIERGLSAVQGVVVALVVCWTLLTVLKAVMLYVKFREVEAETATS